MRCLSLAPWGILLLRLTIGSLFIAHLYWKFFVLPGGVSQWMQMLDRNGYGWPVAWYGLTVEFMGAILITAGIGTRLLSLYALPFMIGAAHFWAVRKGFFFTNSGAELPVVWAVLLAVQALLGPGRWALQSALWPKGIRGVPGGVHEGGMA